MSLRRVIPASTVAAQRDASDPHASVWVSAHAGSGKTHVLTQRVVRLLLEGAPPSKILCLTYTKAAAANMSLRVFETLSRWTMLDDDALMQAIAATGALPVRHNLDFARRLFARTVETPGGLKIQTIHAFCERLLHLFPFEANLPARFQLIEADQAAELLDHARRDALIEAMSDATGELGKSLMLLARSTSQSTFADLLRDALGKRRVLRQAIRRAEGLAGYSAYLAARLGLVREETLAAVERAMLEDGIPPARWNSCAERLAVGKTNDSKLACKLRLAASVERASRLQHYVDVFFTQEGGPRGNGNTKIISKDLQEIDPELLSELETERDRLETLLEKRRAAKIVENSTALVIVLDRILQKYESAKNARALLDFDDLIDKTLNLLSRAGAGWVLYKLDSGIDHVLIDEAQDTSPEQWEILRCIADEFTAGAGQRSGIRTFFAVGDEKQSIYSFQGAQPAKFAEMERHFSGRAKAVSQKFRNVSLHRSFRSAPKILETVNTVFARPENRRGLSSDDAAPFHQALREGAPGLVEIWQPVAPTAEAPARSWRLPLDFRDATDPPVFVADRVAKLVASWLAPGSRERVYDEKAGALRPICAGDVIVLVRTRAVFFEAMIRAFKEAHVPVAGADRLRFTEHIAVMDLVAAGRASLLPQDDLTLACLLKSPLIGLGDDDLIELAPRRPGALIDALAASKKQRHLDACRRLEVWRARARQSTPFMFYAHLLGADGGRRDLVGRLGAEASDAIDEFLNQAVQYEKNHAPSLPAFLAALEATDSDVKRDMDAATNDVRVMTVHAAKGLEAKIVILADTCSLPTSNHDTGIFVLEDASGWPALAWSPRKKDDDAVLAAARAQAARAAQDEYRRLLYVAMTRAEERLYVMGYVGVRKRSPDCWYDMMRDALVLEEATAFDGESKVLRSVDAPALSVLQAGVAANVTSTPRHSTPEWLIRALPREHDAPPPLRPSTVLSAADAPDRPQEWQGQQNMDALRLGRLMHGLLQHLPDVANEKRQAAAERFLGVRAPGLAERDGRRLVASALAVIAHPHLTPLFAPGARAEAAVVGRVEIRPGKWVDISGQIDRLAITGSEVLIADFKTGAPTPGGATSIAYAAQLALYRAALATLYPAMKVRALLVWTGGPTVVELEDDELKRALAIADNLPSA